MMSGWRVTQQEEWNLLDRRNTSLMGMLWEWVVERWLRHQGIRTSRAFPPFAADVERELGQQRVQVLREWWDGGASGPWAWDLVGVKPRLEFSRRDAEFYLVEVKTRRQGKRPRGLKGNWSRRSRRAITQAEMRSLEGLGFRLLLADVELLEDWRFRVTLKELQEETNDDIENTRTVL